MISPTSKKIQFGLALHKPNFLLRHILMVQMKPKPKACTSSTKCHCFCFLYRIPITCVINWSSSCWFPIYLVEAWEKKKLSAPLFFSLPPLIKQLNTYLYFQWNYYKTFFREKVNTSLRLQLTGHLWKALKQLAIVFMFNANTVSVIQNKDYQLEVC